MSLDAVRVIKAAEGTDTLHELRHTALRKRFVGGATSFLYRDCPTARSVAYRKAENAYK